MDLELNTNAQNPLRQWRLRARLSADQVDLVLGFQAGTTELYELVEFRKVPLKHIAGRADLYAVTEQEFYEVMARWYQLIGGRDFP